MRYCAAGVLASLISLPFPPAPAQAFALLRDINPELSAQVGWPQEVTLVASVYKSLPPAQRARAVLLAGNYGEAGAIDYFGQALGLPRAVSGHNNFWLWGPPPRATPSWSPSGWTRQCCGRRSRPCAR